ncbi:MAG TPA: hypothetical protein VIM20_06690 [Candidatus Limnocylindrales bacterium]
MRRSAAAAAWDVRDDRVLAPDQRRREALGGLVIQHTIPAVSADGVDQDDDRDREISDIPWVAT